MSFVLPDLEERFQAPPGLRYGSFSNPATGHTLYYCHAAPEDGTPVATVVCLGGLTEFSEKYYELARDLLKRGYAFWFMDWAYQGRSSRFARYPHRRHSDGFDKDISDLDLFLETVVAATDTPRVLIGHSMGGHLAVRYLADHPGRFAAAALSAPFFGIHGFGKILQGVAWCVERMLPLIGAQYVFNGKDWIVSGRMVERTNIFSGDPSRNRVHDAWLQADEDLRIGSVTFGWVIEALRSCKLLMKTETLERITIPVLIGIAGRDTIVDNGATRQAAAQLRHATIIDIPDARHEILMETDARRDVFLRAFDTLMAGVLNG